MTQPLKPFWYTNERRPPTSLGPHNPPQKILIHVSEKLTTYKFIYKIVGYIGNVDSIRSIIRTVINTLVKFNFEMEKIYYNYLSETVSIKYVIN